MPPAEPSGAGSSRPMPRVLLLIAAALLIARVGTGIWEARHAPPPIAATPAAAADKVSWVEPARAESESRRTGKPILYEFSADWCGPCQMMAREVFADAASAERIGTWFVPVRVIDRQREMGMNPPDIERLEQFYRIDAFPTLVVAWPGDAPQQQASGYRGREGTLAWMAAAAAKARSNSPLPADTTVR